MKKLLLAGVAALAVLSVSIAAAEPDALGCFTRTFSRAHLARRRPWCEYRDVEYYGWLLGSMFGWPVLIAILLLASRWAIAGFSEPNKPN